MTNDTKVKILQTIVFLGSILGPILIWDLSWFLWALAAGVLVFGFSGSIALHRCFAHKTFVPKNDLIKVFLLYIGTVMCVGSSIAWAGTHRLHHATADTEKDPHPPGDKFWTYIRTWFNYWTPDHTPQMNLGLVRDMASDWYHKFFHKNYYKINYVTWAVLLLISPKLFAYFLVATAVGIYGISYITTWAHGSRTVWNRLCYRNYDTPDYTVNNHFLGILMFGEGYHNNHHKQAGSYKIAHKWYEFDIGSKIIELIGRDLRK